MSHKTAPWRASLMIIAAAAALYGAQAKADLYTFTDSHGVVHYSSSPQDSRYRLVASTPSTSVTATIANGTTTVASAAPTTLYVSAPRRSTYGYEPAHRRLPFQNAVDRIAREEHVSAALIHAVITAESHYNPRARSRCGAIGLMQLLPSTARRFGVRNLSNPVENIRAGTRYLASLLHQFNNNAHLAVAAYNAGEGSVIRYGYRVPPFRETRSYVPRVMAYYASYRGTDGDHS